MLYIEAKKFLRFLPSIFEVEQTGLRGIAVNLKPLEIKCHVWYKPVMLFLGNNHAPLKIAIDSFYFLIFDLRASKLIISFQ